uniref:Regulatory protein E2 n=1 Tax=Human papillomavirus TaxID=10566 RepID=A0A385PIQ6_9PAPI|nr:MAG: E2 protein [Human papillomavirus]
MEALSDRFNVLQDKLMTIYERASELLADQIEHWNLLRQEQVLFHYARKRGVLRLGYQPVPTLTISEAKAKEAIAMVLHLQALQKSPYKDEKWTLVDTSVETFRTPPENCFKKGPKTIEIVYDGNPDNTMLYTIWTFIYFEDDEGSWQKTEGQLDYHGAYYLDGMNKQYYIRFAQDARRFSETGEWEVKFNNETLFAPVTSSTNSEEERDRPALASDPGSLSQISRRLSPVPVQRKSPTKRRYGRKDSSPTTTSRGIQRRPKASPRRSRSRSGSRSGSQGDARTLLTVRRGERERGQGRGRGSRVRGRSGHRSRSRSRSRSRERGRAASRGRGGYRTRQSRSKSVDTSGISPDQVGRSLQSVGRQHSGRLARLLDEARDPPVILLKGKANTLKCYRYRAKEKYRGYYDRFSTTWSWVGAGSNDRIGRSRLLISFTSKSQRQMFLSIMKLPKGVDWSFGCFDSI